MTRVASHIAVAVVLIAGVALMVQERRIDVARRDVAELRRNVRQAERKLQVYRVEMLRTINAPLAALDTEQLNLTGEGILFLVVDTRCDACERALRALKANPHHLPVHVASFVDDHENLLAWLRTLGVEFPIVPAPNDHPLMRRLPRSATPVFLEVRRGVATDIVIGQPRSEWWQEAQ